MSDISGPWADPEGLKRVKSLTPKNIIELNKLQVKLPSVHRLSHRRRAARLPRVENTVDNRVHPQAQSLFFRLPAELRVVIYQDLLTLLRPLHIWNTENRLASWECTREGPLSFTDGVGLCCKHPDTAFNELLTERRRRSWVLGLLRSCRRIYFEAIHCLYELNGFHIHHPDTLRRFSKGPQLSSIRSLHLTLLPFIAHYIDYNTKKAWPGTCALLKRMKNLHNLRISFITSRPRWGAWFPSLWMNPYNPQPLDPSPLLKALCGILVPEFLVEIAPNPYVLQWWGELDNRPDLNAEWWFFGYPVVLRSWDYQSDTDYYFDNQDSDGSDA